MEKITAISEAELVETMEQNIACFILGNVDKKHFENGEEIDFDLYDKDRINKKLRKKSDKELAKITFAGKVMYDMLMSFDITINRRAFTFLAFLKDLEVKNNTL
jgi:hypothetical protein